MFSVHIIITCRYVFRKYYTDLHDVDEELMSISAQGGRWGHADGAGIATRYMNRSPTYVADLVASKK